MSLIKEPKRVEIHIETWAKGFSDTHIHIDGEYCTLGGHSSSQWYQVLEVGG